MDIQVNALPAYGAQAQICNVVMERNIRLFWGAIGTGWKTTSNTSPRISPPNTIPWDGVPGGTKSTETTGPISQTSTTPAINQSNTFLGNVWRSVFYLLFNVNANIQLPFSQKEFSFVPVTSALDVQNVTASTFSQSFNFAANGLLGSRTNKYISQEKADGLFNIEHTNFTPRNGRWLYNQMENLTQPTTCDDVCSNITINGPAEICNTGVYLIPGLPSYATVTWSSSNVNIATVNNTGTVTKVFNGNITLTAAINFNGGLNCNIPSSLTKTIKVGISPDDLNVRYSRNNQGFQNVIFYNYNNTVVYTQTGDFSVNAFTNLTGTNIYTWSIFTTGGYGYSNFNPQVASATFTLTGTNAPTIPLSVTLTNTLNGCSSNTTKYVVFVGSIPGGRIAGFDVSPNPANTTINIIASRNKNELKANEEEVSLPTIKEIKLIDKMGNIKLTKRYADDLTKTDRINIAGLPNDIYTLLIFNGTDWESHKIVKQ